jgi:hypothetical protein
VKLYAERPGRALGQLVFDALVVLAVVACVWAGRETYRVVELLAGPGQRIEQAGTGFAGSVDRLGDRLDDLPGIGDGLRAPFDAVAGAGRELESAGRAQQEVVHRLALILGLAVGGLPIVVIALFYAPRRGRWVRDASDAAALRSAGPPSLALFAHRAVANRPLRELRRASDDPGGDLARGDYDALAALELRALGLRTKGRIKA